MINMKINYKQIGNYPSKPPKTMPKPLPLLYLLILLVGFSQAQVDYETPIVDMTEYKNYYRVLDCWQCFEAKGIMCTHKAPEYLPQLTQSTNRGLGICCNPKEMRGICSPANTQLECSMESFEARPTYYKEILSLASRNNQLFAFCPSTTAKGCGIPETPDGDGSMSLFATQEQKIVYANHLAYRQADPKQPDQQGQYDSCYYEIKLSKEVSKEQLDSLKAQSSTSTVNINFLVQRNKDMNIYIYGGNTRYTAPKSIVDNNLPAELGIQYSINVEEGLLVVAYPNKDVYTELEFKYWIEPEKIK